MTTQSNDRSTDDADFIDSHEVARLLDIAESTVRNWRCRGDGPTFYRLSARCIRYRKHEVIEWATREGIAPLD